MNRATGTQTMRLMFAIIPSGSWLVVALGVLLAPTAVAQSITSKQGAVPVRSDFAKKRAAYQTAYEDLAKGDPNLEKELLTADHDEILKRIDGQSRRAQQFTKARVELYESM